MARLIARLTAEEMALKQQWEARVARYQAGDADALPAEVAGLGMLRVMGRSGDEALAFPRVQRSALATLPADVQFGVALAERTLDAHRQGGAGRMVYVVAEQGQPLAEPKPLTTLDPFRDTEILVVAPLAGGL
jgi:hypothetical protein